MLEPLYQGRHGPVWGKNQVLEFIVHEIKTKQHIQRRVKKVNNDIFQAKTVLTEAEKMLDQSLQHLKSTEERVSQEAKKISGNVRKAADDLMSGLTKIQKTANFPALERQVELLERAAAALTTLAELEKSGRLDKVLAAVK